MCFLSSLACFAFFVPYYHRHTRDEFIHFNILQDGAHHIWFRYGFFSLLLLFNEMKTGCMCSRLYWSITFHMRKLHAYFDVWVCTRCACFKKILSSTIIVVVVIVNSTRITCKYFAVDKEMLGSNWLIFLRSHTMAADEVQTTIQNYI